MIRSSAAPPPAPRSRRRRLSVSQSGGIIVIDMQPIKGSRIVFAALSITGAFAPLGCQTPSAERGLPGNEPLRWAPSTRAGHLWPEPQGERLFTVTVGKAAPAPLTVRTASRPDGWRETTGSWSAVDVIRTASGALQTKAEHDLRNRRV